MNFMISKVKNRTNIILAIIVMLYSAIALFRLGEFNNPQSHWECQEKGYELIFEFDEEIDLSAVVYYLGNYGNRKFQVLLGHGDPIQWEDAGQIVFSQVYQWRAQNIGATVRSIKFITENVYTQIGELLFLDNSGNRIVPVNSRNYPELFDESDSYQGKSTYQTGTVFDEPVYARTAFEYLNGMRPYEDTHPPLGKLLIAPGIALFGMNTFGWRFSGTVAGILIICLIAFFSQRMFSNPWISVGVTSVFACDFMLFTHTRLAQIDSFLVLFILGMFYFLYLFGETLLDSSLENKRRNTCIYIWLSGFSFGCAAACKWSGAYCIPGILGIFGSYLIIGFKKKAISNRELYYYIACFIPAFILIPGVIYVLSYIPYIPVNQELGFWEGMIQNQINMFRYHTSLTAANAESAKWFQWPLIAVPITFCDYVKNGMKECVYLLGNPALWISGICAFFYCLYESLNSLNRKSLFLIVMYLSPLLPWMMVPRSSFIYHYFPCLPALALMLGCFSESKKKYGLKLLFAIVVISIILFIMYYPILSGLPMSAEYVEFLEWFPWWDF